MDRVSETKQRCVDAGANNRAADHLIRLQLRCQDDAGANERLPIVVVDGGSVRSSYNKLPEQDRNIMKFQEQGSNMSFRQNKTSKSHHQQHQLQPQQQQEQQQQRLSTSSRRSSQKSSPTNNCNVSSPTPTANGVISSQMQQLNHLHHSTISINGHSHTFGSHRSTATDSSGFSSGASTTSCHGQSQTVASLNFSDCHQRANNMTTGERHESRANLIRSQLIEDLNRLEKMAAAAAEAKARRELQAMNSHSISPDDSTMAGRHSTVANGGDDHVTPIATLSRSAASNCVELDYSTLCRDEFSSFIDYKTRTNEHAENRTPPHIIEERSDKVARANSMQVINKSKGSRRHRNGISKHRLPLGGPMLVGVHECETPRDSNCIMSPSYCASSSSSPACSERNLAFGSGSSSSELNFLTKGDHNYDEDNDDRELVCHEIFGDNDDGGGGDRRRTIELAAIAARKAQRLCEVHVEENFSDDNSVDLAESQPMKKNSQLLPSKYHVELNLSNKDPDGQDKLSEMLDVYLRRVESLLKLANGDKSVSLNELIEGRSPVAGVPYHTHAQTQITVRDEFQTPIAYVPSSKRAESKPKVIQEIEMTIESECTQEYTDDEDDNESYANCDTETITTDHGSNFEALLSSPQTSAILNWWPIQLSAPGAAPNMMLEPTDKSDHNNNQHKNAFIDQQQCRLLERSFLSRWLELCSNDDEEEHNERNCESLVKTIRRHMSEFVANYNLYQESMRHETSFSRDWHENWLFATSMRKCLPLKRAHQMSEAQLQQSSDSSREATTSLIGRNSTLTNSGQHEHHHQQQQVSPKRAKLMQSSSSVETNELLNYSTLLINKYKPVKVTFVDERDQDNSVDESGTSEIERKLNRYRKQIDIYYEQQPNYLSELQQTFLELSGQVNVCHLLLSDSYESDTVEEIDLGTKRAKRSLEIEYESSLNSGRSHIDGQLLCFRAHGHLFRVRKLRHFKSLASSMTHKQKIQALKRLILSRLSSACHWRTQNSMCSLGFGDAKLAHMARELPLKQRQQDQVRFIVQITDVQLSQPLPVIQFCAKVAGALPIRVGWYRLLEDGSHQELTSPMRQSQSRTSTLTAFQDDDYDEWPLTMRANYDLQYQNDWLSWYKFKRKQSDILFEIRGAHLERDYGQTFKCVIENYCSIKECEFKFELRRCELNKTLLNPLKEDMNKGQAETRAAKMMTRKNRRDGNTPVAKSADEFGRVRLNRVELASENQEAGQAILRTWSQRTLNKRAPLIAHNEMSSNGGHEQADHHHGSSAVTKHNTSDSLLHGACQQLHTVGRLSARAMDDCKFGTNYPYHPVSLMRRLEENKMSLTLRSGLRLASRRPNDDHHLSVNATWREDENSDGNNSSRNDDDNDGAPAGHSYELAPNQHNQHANPESEPSSRHVSSPPFASTSALANRPEVRDCGEPDVGRVAATFMRPSRRLRASNTASSQRQLLFGGGQSNQDNDGTTEEDQQKSNDDDEEGHDGESTDCLIAQSRAPEPTPRPRQKPTVAVNSEGQGDNESAAAPPRRQRPLGVVGNPIDDNCHDHHHHKALHSAGDLPLSPPSSCKQPIGRQNCYDDSCRSEDDHQKSRLLNNWQPSIARAEQTQSKPLANVDDLQAPRITPSASTAISRSRTSRLTDDEQENCAAVAAAKQLWTTGSSNGSSDRPAPPNRQPAELGAKPKSVRSLISRFNMI